MIHEGKCKMGRANVHTAGQQDITKDGLLIHPAQPLGVLHVDFSIQGKTCLTLLMVLR